MIRRILCLALAAGLLLCLTAAPEQALAETYVPLPELLLFRQDNVQKDLGAQRKECRTYPRTANEQVNALVSQVVDRLADETLNHLPKAGGEVMTWADTGASVTVTVYVHVDVPYTDAGLTVQARETMPGDELRALRTD